MSPCKPRTVLLTRRQELAKPWADQLAQAGIESLTDPILVVQPLDPRVMIPKDRQVIDWTAALVTSGNAIAGLDLLGLAADVPIYAVGDTTAAKARLHGFNKVISAAGNGHDLATRVAQDMRPDRGPIVYLAGASVAVDLALVLAAHGFTVERVNCYQMVPATALQPATITAIRSQQISAVALASSQTARVFCQLVQTHNLAPAIARLDSFCLSPQIADIVGRDLRWQHIHIADRPTTSAMLALMMNAIGTGA